MKERIAVAMDVPLERGRSLYAEVAPFVGVVKVGLSLFVEHGPAAVKAFQDQGARVFLDLKLHDIPNTVGLAATRAAALGVDYLTVHASGGPAMIEAAVRAHRGVLAVTVLTSLSDEDVAHIGWPGTPQAAALHLAQIAREAGAAGGGCSPREAAAMRARFGPDFFLCTPGIRGSEEKGDQARAETASFAIHAGSDLLVIGRPIHAATNPAAAAAAFLKEVEGTSGPRRMS